MSLPRRASTSGVGSSVPPESDLAEIVELTSQSMRLPSREPLAGTTARTSTRAMFLHCFSSARPAGSG